MKKKRSVQQNKTTDVGFYIDQLGISLLAMCSLGYVLYAQRFAEWHVQFSFLNFPVFIGEIVLFLCLTLAAVKWCLYKPHWKRWRWAVVLYVLFVVVKALFGFRAWGPLALRDSAMMYYPLFALLAYAFYRRDFFTDRTILLLLGLILLILKFCWFYEYSIIVLVLAACFLIKAYPKRNIRWFLWAALLFLMPYTKFFKGSRTMLIGLIASSIFCLFLLFSIVPIKTRYKFFGSLVLSVFLLWGVKTQFDQHKLQAILDVGPFLKKQQAELDFRRQDFIPIQKDVKDLRLYNPEGVADPGNYAVAYSQHYTRPQLELDREVESAIGTIMFRLYIWEDMIEQMAQAKPVFGFDFGKPLRSYRLEMIGMAVEVWNRDGWIGAHNSFLYLIYRAGVVGVLIIIMLLTGFVRLIRSVLQKRSVGGVLLCSIIFFWIVAANFLLILELPYNAIPLWIIVGITVAYLQKPPEQEDVPLDETVKSELLGLVDKIGTYLLVLCSFGYMAGARRFAESFVQLPCLDFPIFIGEIVLFLCSLLWVIRWAIRPPAWNRWYFIAVAYFLFVVIKAFIGYRIWGALALRDSALMYYPVAALFGYTFYDPKIFRPPMILAGGAIAILAVFTMTALNVFSFYEYFSLMGVVIAFLLIRAYPDKRTRWLLFFWLVIVIPYKDFFGSRTMLLGLVASGIFCVSALSYVLPFKGRYKLLTLICFMLFIFFGVRQYADMYKMKTLLNVRYYRNMLAIFDQEITERKKGYVQQEIKKLRLYNPESDNSSKKKSVVIDRPAQGASSVQILSDRQSSIQGSTQGSTSDGTITVVPDLVPLPEKPKDPELSSVYGNITFRVLIWRDMVDQLMESRPWLGFDFGKPLRSPSIEVLHIAFDEWQRDGWIGAHNSYLHIIYRCGIIGVLVIVMLFSFFCRLISESLAGKSVIGILCCTMLIFWSVSANFLLILELPYNAIPIWALFGVTAAYLARIKEEAV